MARPTTKEGLIDQSKERFEKLNTLIDTFSSEKQNAEFSSETMNRNIRDVLSHLHEWNLFFLTWYEVGMAGQKPDMPAKGYTWKTLPDLNLEVWKKYQDMDLTTARTLYNNSFKKIQQIIEKHTDKELFEKKRYQWTGSTSLGAYAISAASSHIDWAIKLIKKGLK